jgi:hypothetical protein
LLAEHVDGLCVRVWCWWFGWWSCS